MEKINIGMYVRTKDGIIAKVDYIDDNTIFFDKELYRTYGDSIDFLEKDNLERIVKASYNIIDLIEVGDYLNGFKVSKIERYDTNTIIKIGNSTFNVLEGEKIYTPSYDNNNGYEKIEKLKSIVTKEQMEQMSYKVGE